MAELLRMPEIAANMVEAVLSEWPLAENSAFAAGDPIATVETDKAVVDVPAEADGVLLRTLVEPGKSVTVGTPMAVLVAPGERVDDVDALVARLTGDQAPPVRDEPSPAGAREVSQESAAEITADAALNRRAPAPNGGTSAGVESPGAVSAGAVGSASEGLAPARIFASPLARRIAREHGLTIGEIRGTGPGGRIVRDDVRRVLADRAAARPAAAPTPGGMPGRASVPAAAAQPQDSATSTSVPAGAGAQPGPAFSAEGRPASGGGYRDVPHTRMRRAIATRLAESHREAPVFTLRGSARVDALLALRRELNEATDVRISLNDLIVAAAGRAHVAVPEMNVIWLSDAVRLFEEVDIAVAVATEAGLVTPVVRGVDKLTVSALARTGADLVGRARAGKLRQEELEGGTLTVTNLGVFGTEDFTAVINPPQAAILAVGAARAEAVVTEGELAVATVLRVTLSVDHRPVDGATAARWMAAFLALLESPLRILA
jgi:pyruvate dehydrogenase E2 component (dihydrolipoamide acetyltransferase)